MKRVEKCKSNAKLPTTTPLVSKWARDLGYDVLTTYPSTPMNKQGKILHPICKDVSTQTSSILLLMALADVAKKGTFNLHI